MRAIILPVALLMCASSAVIAAEGPLPMEGLWEIVVTPKGASEPERQLHVCVRDLSGDVFAHVEAGLDCAASEWQQNGPRWQMADRCTGPQGNVQRSGVFGGDFAYNFQGDLLTRRDGASRTLQVDGRRLSPCRDLQPGEIRIKGENGINLNRAR